MSNFDFDKQLQICVKHVTNARKAIQRYLIEVVREWHIHGDAITAVNRVNKLLEVLPDGVRKNAIRAYGELSGMRWDDEAKVLVVGKKKITEELAKTMIKKNWWDAQPERPYQPFDLEAQVRRLIEKAQKKAEKGDPRDHINPELLKKLKRALV